MQLMNIFKTKKILKKKVGHLIREISNVFVKVKKNKE